MPPLPTLTAREVVNTFVNLGWEIARQRGSQCFISVLPLPYHEVKQGPSWVVSGGVGSAAAALESFGREIAEELKRAEPAVHP